MNNKRIGIIGAGNMGSAFCKAISRDYSSDTLFVCDKNLDKKELLGIKNFSTDKNEILRNVDVVILAIKPQDLEDFLANLDVSFTDKLVISIIAGIKIETFCERLKAKKVVRAMPNLAVRVNFGLIGWFATNEVSAEEKDFLRKIFISMGFQIELEKESMLDAITALSGSGPAYFFYFTDLLNQKARGLGLSEEDARHLAETVLIGSAKLLERNNKSAKEWISAIASRGGTTEKALLCFEEKDFQGIFQCAIDAAKKRSEELGE